MRYVTIILGIITICAGALLAFFAPDILSVGITVLMTIIVVFGVIFGIAKDMMYYRDFKTAANTVIFSSENGSSWYSFLEKDSLFHQKDLYEDFNRYKEKITQQRNGGQIISDIEEVFNEEALFTRSKQALISQIPGTLTSLGILGTFIGLILGLRGIQFDNAETAMNSVITLLNGIETAFYTIRGVILSLLFNIVNKASWNMAVQEMERFTILFHSKIIPTVDEQNRYRDRQKTNKIINLLEYIADKSDQTEREEKSYEQILMPQIAEGLKKEEFVCCFQPVFNLTDKNITGLEVVVKWKHPKLGLLPPSVFMSTVIHTGYGPKLERYIWEKLFSGIRDWIVAGIRPVPVIISVTKNGLFSKDAPEAFVHLSRKYEVPPKFVNVGIPQEVYVDLLTIAKDMENRFMSNGFGVCIDRFEGNLFPVITNKNIMADTLLIDASMYNGSEESLKTIYSEAEISKLKVIAQNIKSMEQMSMLRKCGIREGCGPYLENPMESADIAKLLPGGES